MNDTGTLWRTDFHSVILLNMRDRAMELLGSNMTPSMTASILGCSEGLISQYMGEEEFATEVTKRRLKTLQATIQRDNKYDNAEDALLDKLKDLIPSMFDPLKILRAIQVINGAKRRGAMGNIDPTTTPQTVVPLVVPVNVAVQFLLNGNNEVIDVGGRSLTPMTQTGVMTKLRELKNDDSRQVPEKLPERVSVA